MTVACYLCRTPAETFAALMAHSRAAHGATYEGGGVPVPVAHLPAPVGEIACSACPARYRPRRRPKSGQRNYCPSCRGKA